MYERDERHGKFVIYVDPDIEDLVPQYLENRRKDVLDIVRLIEEGNFSEVRRIGHSMKGSGGGYGFDAITEIGKGIEDAAKELNKDEVLEWNRRLEEYLSSVKVLVKEDE